MPHVTRRGALGVGMGLAVGGTVRVGSADAEVIHLCDECLRAADAYIHTRDASEDQIDRLREEFEAIELRLEGMPAQTLDGVVAKARMVMRLAVQPDGVVNFDAGLTGRFPKHVVRDLLRVTGNA